jgi:hypothetical protein
LQQQQQQQQGGKHASVTFSTNPDIQRIKRPVNLSKQIITSSISNPSQSVIKSTTSSANNYNRFRQQGPALQKVPIKLSNNNSSITSSSFRNDSNDEFPPPPPIPINQLPHQHSHLQTSLNQPTLLQDYQEPNNLIKNMNNVSRQTFCNVEDEFKKKVYRNI